MQKIQYKWIALSCTSLGALFSVLNGTMLIIALPSIMKDLHVGMSIVMWIIMSYLLVITIFVPAIGRVADIIGRKKLYVGGSIIFTIGSLLCGLSHTGIELLVFRIVQAIGGSLLVANSSPIVADAFPKNELGKAMGINMMIISVASVAGPILGGALLFYGWRSVFFINVPFGILVSIWAGLRLKELDVLPAHQTFDWKGTIAFSIGMLAFLLALSFGGFIGWTNKVIIALTIIAVVFSTAFIYIENHADQPMLDMKLLRTRILACAYGSNLLNGIARGALNFLLVFYFQGIKGMDPILAGVMLTPLAISMMIVAPISGWLSDKFGSRILSSIGLLISAIGLVGFMFITPNMSLVLICIWMFIMGFGSGMFFSPNSNAIMSAVPVERRGIAASVRTMMNNAGNVISIGLAMAIISTSITPQALQGLFAGTQVGSQGIAIGEFIHGLRTAFTISFIFSLLAAIISFVRGPQPIWESESRLNSDEQK